ncbi:hypothetical protein AAF712_003251 [Marasmius tenuissimus]|uniref:Uncharacterized protein n=1 Tax=Marasmius tenuissimus TaxID=585030 RepID=A0ABR3A7K8_9AGAR|nr:hypothetical protein PM082_012057 [Marasmius tenuissimus]
MTTAYSSFFSSGLTSSNDIYPRPRPRMDSTSSSASFTSMISTTSTIKSPGSQSNEALDDTSDVEDGVAAKRDARRSMPPRTPSNQSTRTLRRRRSSLSTQASPVTVVRSMANALSFHKKSRSRSGSVNSANPVGPGASNESASSVGIGAAVPGVKGRLRSGSVGTALKSIRRGLRKLPTNPLPPPSAPLPPLPPLPSNDTTPPTRRPHSRSISLVPRVAGLNLSREPLPPMPPTPPSRKGTEADMP